MPRARRLRHRLGQNHAWVPPAGEACHPRSGPVWNGGRANEDELLAGCYRTALALAADHGLASIAFPAISTGVYAFPADRAARIAVGTVMGEISAAPRTIEHVVFCCFAPESAQHHVAAFTDLGLA
jgi:O-acetyl-ADP-ribose deacetylase (regulator of RNase III)